MTVRKPLFTDEFVAFSPFDQRALSELIRQARRPGCRMLEVGSWFGKGSTRVFIDNLRGVGTLCCVDTWRGNPNVERHQQLVAEYDVMGTFLANVMDAGDMVRPMRFSSRDAAAIVADNTFDLVFIDADHSYDAVIDDVTLWRPKVRRGGILAGHDCEGRPDELGIERLRMHRHLDTIEGTTRFPRVHPGCILAIGELFGGAVNLFAESPFTLDDGSCGASTIWWKAID